MSRKDLETGLTEEQELFCQLYCQGTYSNKECYLTAYPNSSEKSAEANSSRLLKNEKVIRRINQLLDEMQEDCEVSNKAIIRRLKQIAFSSKNDMASLKALDMLGKITKLFGDENSKVTNNIITISVDDKIETKQGRIENKPNEVNGCSFEIIDDNGEE